MIGKQARCIFSGAGREQEQEQQQQQQWRVWDLRHQRLPY
jgi:hypothetical protein